MRIVIVIEDREPTPTDPVNIRVDFSEFKDSENEPVTQASLLCAYIDGAIDDYFARFADQANDAIAKDEQESLACLH